MIYYQLAAWAVIIGLSFMSVGGLVLWAYGARRAQGHIARDGMEADATLHFHTRLTRWFYIYGLMLMLIGAAMLMWSGTVFYK